MRPACHAGHGVPAQTSRTQSVTATRVRRDFVAGAKDPHPPVEPITETHSASVYLRLSQTETQRTTIFAFLV